MKTTVMLDKDVERMLRNAMHRSGQTLKETLNAAVRRGLSETPARATRVPFTVKARPMGLRDGADPTSFNRLTDDLDVDAVVRQTRRPKRP
jgi:hypothetical protein